VVAPGNQSKSDDASTCVCVLLISKRQRISAKQAAAHLRFVPWEKRHTRYLPPAPANGFSKEELEVRSVLTDFDPRAPQIFFGMSDDLVTQVYFGHNTEQKNGIAAGLARFLTQRYADWGYRYLHEIRASRAASSRLATGNYHLFWINSDPDDTEQDISDELQLLIEKYAKPAREKLADAILARTGDDWKALKEVESFLLKEYEYDYGALRPP
jgi:hypothetical protein